MPALQTVTATSNAGDGDDKDSLKLPPFTVAWDKPDGSSDRLSSPPAAGGLAISIESDMIHSVVVDFELPRMSAEGNPHYHLGNPYKQHVAAVLNWHHPYW